MTNKLENWAMMRAVLRALTPPIVAELVRSRLATRSVPHRAESGREQSSAFYDAKYTAIESYHRHYADSPYYFIWCVLADRISHADVRCLFDVGCGPGQFGALLRDRGLKKYIGLDFSSQSIRLARAACPEFEFVCADAFATDLFQTLDYSLLVSTEFLEHVEDDLGIIDRIRPGTRVLCTVPNFPHEAHVRCFGTAEEVSERYGSRFSSFRVDRFLYGSGGMCFFLFDGVRGA